MACRIIWIAVLLCALGAEVRPILLPSVHYVQSIHYHFSDQLVASLDSKCDTVLWQNSSSSSHFGSPQEHWHLQLQRLESVLESHRSKQSHDKARHYRQKRLQRSQNQDYDCKDFHQQWNIIDQRFSFEFSHRHRFKRNATVQSLRSIRHERFCGCFNNVDASQSWHPFALDLRLCRTGHLLWTCQRWRIR